MPDDPRIEELLEELLDSGGAPEEVCRACPELLTQVRAGWQRLRAVEAEIGVLFPESTLSDGTRRPLATAALPRICRYDVQAEHPGNDSHTLGTIVPKVTYCQGLSSSFALLRRRGPGQSTWPSFPAGSPQQQ